jgi:hypothetical protein
MPQPSATTAYQQVTQWDQAWQTMSMATPLAPLNDADASNDGIQKPEDEEPGSTGVDTYA